MKLSLQIKNKQNLVITPQLQQAIHLLQLSSKQLKEEIQKTLDSNIMLEISDDHNSANQTEELALINDMTTTANHTDKAGLQSSNDAGSDNATDHEYISTADSKRRDYQDSRDALENHGSQGPTLREELLWQLNLMQINDADKDIAIAMIDMLDENGYLNLDLDEARSIVSEKSGGYQINADKITQVLRIIQALEPAGIGARNLQECLLLQLNQHRQDSLAVQTATRLISGHIELLAKKDYKQIKRLLKIDQQELITVIDLIQSLDPRPGLKIHTTCTEYIIPDVYAKKIDGRWLVETNPQLLTKLRINPDYSGMIRRADNSEENLSLKDHLQQAKWFLKNLENRDKTILRVAKSIVDHQRAFIEYGDEAMKPMTLSDIAEELGMHESTISRVTAGKYINIPRGSFEFKYFFSSHLYTGQGEAASSTAIRALIKKIIAAETPQKPLSDNKIKKILSERGVRVARRTVAKYREAMNIPPSNERKHLG